MEKKGKYMPIWGRYAEMFLSDRLTNAQVGELLRTMIRYHFDEEECTNLSRQLEGYWYFLKQDLDNAQSRYEVCVQNGQKGGQKSAQVRKTKKTPEAEPETVEDEENASCEASEDRQEAMDTKVEATETEAVAPVSQEKQNQPITRTRTESRTRSESRSNYKKYFSDHSQKRGVSVQRQYGRYGWVKLSDEQYHELQQLMGAEILGKCIDCIDSSAQSTNNKNRWKDWSAVIRRYYDNHWYEPKYENKTDSIPKGASGELGEAELEAIRRVLQMDIPDVPDEALKETPVKLPALAAYC